MIKDQKGTNHIGEFDGIQKAIKSEAPPDDEFHACGRNGYEKQ